MPDHTYLAASDLFTRKDQLGEGQESADDVDHNKCEATTDARNCQLAAKHESHAILENAPEIMEMGVGADCDEGDTSGDVVGDDAIKLGSFERSIGPR